MNEKLIQRIKERAAAKGISISDLQKDAGLGTTFVRDLASVQSPRMDSLQKIARVLGIQVSELSDQPQAQIASGPFFTEDEVRRAILAVMNSAGNRAKPPEFLADLILGVLNAQAIEVSDSKLRA